MELDKKLKFADKYNRWTKQEDKDKIDIETKISYLMLKWKSEELFFVFKNFPLDVLKKSYNIIKKDWYSLKEKRKWAIETLLKYKSLKK